VEGDELRTFPTVIAEADNSKSRSAWENCERSAVKSTGYMKSPCGGGASPKIQLLFLLAIVAYGASLLLSVKNYYSPERYTTSMDCFRNPGPASIVTKL